MQILYVYEKATRAGRSLKNMVSYTHDDGPPVRHRPGWLPMCRCVRQGGRGGLATGARALLDQPQRLQAGRV